jgi:predicted DNA-binding ArsR family transcriptional regulator
MMSIFDQRGQKVTYQYNAAGNINFGAVQNKMEVIVELQKLQAEVTKAIEAGVFEEDTATDVEYQVKKAVQQSKQSEPDKKTILDHLNEAKALISGVAAAAGLVTALGQAVEIVQKLF